jgi:hypothetical protein
MKKILLSFFVFITLCGYAFSFDLNSIKDYLEKDLSIIKNDFPNINFSADLYSYTFIENGNEYSIKMFLYNNKIVGIECTVFVNNQNEANELFNKIKKENTMPSGERLISDTINEYSWVQSNLIIIQIVNDNSKYGVMLCFLSP